MTFRIIGTNNGRDWHIWKEFDRRPDDKHIDAHIQACRYRINIYQEEGPNVLMPEIDMSKYAVAHHAA